MAKCEVCGNEFEAVRSTAKFCSPVCRVKASRLSVTDQTPGEVLSVTENLSVTPKEELSVTSDTPARLSVTPDAFINVTKDLKLDLKKDLGCMGWSPDGIFILPDITIDQVRNIRRLVEAKNGWKHREYGSASSMYSSGALISRQP